VEGNSAGHFRLHTHREQDGVLYLDLQVNGALDREQQSDYDLVIEARDGGRPSLTATLQVHVQLLDVNDNEPQFAQSAYYAVIAENATLGTRVLRVTATDSDEAANARIRYHLQLAAGSSFSSLPRNANAAGSTASPSVSSKLPFEIDSDGWIVLSGSLNYSQAELHRLLIIARDSGDQPLATSALCTIKVRPQQVTLLPSLNIRYLTSNLQPEMLESAPIGAPIAQVSVQQPPSEQSISSVQVRLLPSTSNTFRLRLLRPSMYLLELAGSLDRESQATHRIELEVFDSSSSDKSKASQMSALSLTVLDVNDNAPYFNQTEYDFSVPDWTEVGSEIGQVTAIDDDLIDAGSTVDHLHYAIDATQSDSTALQWFAIDSKSGQLRTQTTLDCEHNTQPMLTITANDGLHKSAFTRVRLHVHDANDVSPLFQHTFYHVEVAENATIGTCFLQLQATDADCASNGSIAYSLESDDVPAEVGHAQLGLGPFQLQPDTGRLCVRRPLSSSIRSQLEFTAIAQDTGKFEGRARVRVQIVQRATPPFAFLPTEYKVAVPENRVPLLGNGLPAALLQLNLVKIEVESGHKRLSTKSFVYEIIAGNEEQAFELDVNSGALYLLRPLSSSHTAHVLTVQSTSRDGVRSVNQATIRVHVLSMESGQFNSPQLSLPTQSQWSLQQFNVSETARVGQSIGLLSVADAQQPLNCSIYDGDVDSHFRLQNYQIWINKQLDYEQTSQYVLNVQCFGENRATFVFLQAKVQVTDVNDNPPRFAARRLSISLSEDRRLDSQPILIAQATDDDSPQFGPLKYELVEQSKPYFSIDSNDGTIRLIRLLDYETQRSIEFRVRVTDAAGLSDQMIVTVLVQDVNDNSPKFKQTSQHLKLSTAEDVALHTMLHRFEAEDVDSGRNARLTFTLLGCNQSCPFALHSSNGMLRVQSLLDREQTAVYSLQVRVCDHGQPQRLCVEQQLTIQVLDVNDNAPRCVQQQARFAVNESVAVDSLIGRVQAIDLDSGLNGTVRYYFDASVAGAAQIQNQFRLDEQTGKPFDLS
jgi:hypothetical protein